MNNTEVEVTGYYIISINIDLIVLLHLPRLQLYMTSVIQDDMFTGRDVSPYNYSPVHWKEGQEHSSNLTRILMKGTMKCKILASMDWTMMNTFYIPTTYIKH